MTLSSSIASTVSINTIDITGPAAGDFSETNGCPASLATNATRQISVTFKPSTSGTRTASISVTSNASGEPTTAALTGTGFYLAISPWSLSFPYQAQNTTSAVQAITLTNTGTAAVSISSISATGDFAQTNNCGTGLCGGGNCTISVTFTPTASGSRTGSITVTDSDVTSPQAVPLSGLGLANGVSAI